MGSSHTTLLFLLLASIVATLSSSSLPAELAIAGHGDSVEFASEERVVELFQRWMEKHNKVYKHSEEMQKRFTSFKRNLRYIIERNSDKSSKKAHSVGLNRFADLSNEEFKEMYFSKVKKPINKMSAATGLRRSMEGRKIESCDAPSSLDWRNSGVVTGVKDQGSCGKHYFLFHFYIVEFVR